MRSFGFALFCLPVCIGFGFFCAHVMHYQGFLFYAAAGGFMAAALCWRLLIHKRTHCPLRALFAGALAALVGMLLMFYLMSITNEVFFPRGGWTLVSIRKIPEILVTGVLGAFICAAVGIYSFGSWLAIVAGAALGWAFQKLLQRKDRLNAP